jgi:DHA1 family multidrug resistance protein-like MFS transporter
MVCCGTFVASFDSGLFAAGASKAAKEFHVSSEVGNLGTSLYILGFASGPLIWAPASELIGRRWPLCIGMFGCSIFTIAAATAKDIQTLVICRFFGGIFGASPLSIVPAVLADMYGVVYRGVAISLYSLAVFIGPLVSPFIGGFISASYLGWRWTLYIPAIMGFTNTAFLLLFLDETYAPFVLVKKAVKLRERSDNWAIHADQEKLEFDLHKVLRDYFTLPLKMLVTEPILLLVTLYMSFIYGLVYALLGAYPYVFQDTYGMPEGVNGLPIIGIAIGVVLALLFILSQHGSYVKKLQANGNKSVPEWRLFPAIVGGFVFAGGLFWWVNAFIFNF